MFSHGCGVSLCEFLGRSEHLSSDEIKVRPWKQSCDDAARSGFHERVRGDQNEWKFHCHSNKFLLFNLLILVIYHNFPLQSSGIYVDSVIFTEKYTVRRRCGIPDSGKVKEGWKEQGEAEFIFSPFRFRIFYSFGSQCPDPWIGFETEECTNIFLESRALFLSWSGDEPQVAHSARVPGAAILRKIRTFDRFMCPNTRDGLKKAEKSEKKWDYDLRYCGKRGIKRKEQKTGVKL